MINSAVVFVASVTCVPEHAPEAASGVYECGGLNGARIRKAARPRPHAPQREGRIAAAA